MKNNIRRLLKLKKCAADGYEWVAHDADGFLFAYNFPPRYIEGIWQLNGEGKFKCLFKEKPQGQFSKSLCKITDKIKEYE